MSYDSTTRGHLKLNRSLKKSVLEAMLAQCQTIYMHCVPHPKLEIGKRGLTKKEKEEGILLVFGPHSMRDLHLNDKYIRCRLQFQRWESVQIPIESISRLFDKGSQVTMDWFYMPALRDRKTLGNSVYVDESESEDGENSTTVPFVGEKIRTARSKAKKKKIKSSGKVIQVDFRRD